MVLKWNKSYCTSDFIEYYYIKQSLAICKFRPVPEDLFAKTGHNMTCLANLKQHIIFARHLQRLLSDVTPSSFLGSSICEVFGRSTIEKGHLAKALTTGKGPKGKC